MKEQKVDLVRLDLIKRACKKQEKENNMGVSLKEIKEYIGIVRWKYAKTMPKHPHEYTVKEWDLENVDMFNKFVVFIREEGYDEYFYRRKMRYCNIEGYKYWTMGAPLEKTILINRAKI